MRASGHWPISPRPGGGLLTLQRSELLGAGVLVAVGAAILAQLI